MAGLAAPTSMAWAPDGSGRMFVTEKASGVRVVQNGQLLPTPFVSFPTVYSENECGVLSVVFDPAYALNRWVYVFVTVSDHEQRIMRFRDVENVGMERVNIITGLPTMGANHNGGAMAFGADGKLYWAIGDLGDKRGVDGDLRTLAAKVGRANADGSVPGDNPFRDGAGPNNDYIWATGFRNPFTMTLQPRTGKLWLNVVGSTPNGQTEPNSTPGYEQVFALNRADDGGYDDYEGNQPAGERYTTPFARPFAHPVIQYKTDTFDDAGQVRSIDSVARSAGVVTVTTTSAHPFRIGQAVNVDGAGVLSGTYVVRAVPTSATFTAAASGVDATETGGTAQPVVIGSAITGGTFYESTAFPAEYRGNFFWCDYTGGVVMRARLDSENKPVSIAPFVVDAGSVTDTSVGPDGALYYLNVDSGDVWRVAATNPSGLVVTPTSMRLLEGGSGVISVRLAVAPTGNVSVRTGAADPDGPVLVTGGGEITFTPQNWDVPQSVSLASPVDADTEDAEETVILSATGFSPVEVNVGIADTSALAPVVSVSAMTLTEGARSQSFTVALSEPPSRPVTFAVRRATGPAGVKISGGRMTFNARNFNRPKTVRVSARQDRNTVNESNTLSIAGRGYERRNVAVTVLDNDPSPPTFTSAPKTQAVAGLPYLYSCSAVGLPAPTYALIAGPAGMTVDAATGAVTWPVPTLGSHIVTLTLDNGRAPGAQQSFTLMVAADEAPSLVLSAPHEGQVVAGSHAEFFGSGSDDYRCVKAEFYVDDVLVFTDSGTTGHYHLFGGHALWDTTGLANGPHTVKMIVFDDLGQTATASASVTVAN